MPARSGGGGRRAAACRGRNWSWKHGRMLLAVRGMPPKSQLLIPTKFDRETLRLLLHAQARIQFYLGDAINFAGERYARGKYDACLETCGVSYVSLKAYAWIARSVSPKFRRPDLFGLMSRTLDFDVEAVHSAFPDCSAKRLIDRKRNRWTACAPIFSSTFHSARHPAARGAAFLRCSRVRWSRPPRRPENSLCPG